MTTTIASQPLLAPPGAGLPAPELWIARILFTFRRITGGRESFTAKFHSEREMIRRLLASADPEQCARRVLIDRVRGLEDSSRNWSVWMTLEHLRIIHVSLIRIISTLASGQTPEGTASTAAVNPGEAVDAAVVSTYEASCDHLLATAAAVPDLATATRYAHPWFGSLDAKGWYALAGAHLAIHRVQIERILSASAAA